VSAGHVGPVADVMSSAPTDGKGQLLAIKGSAKAVQGVWDTMNIHSQSVSVSESYTSTWLGVVVIQISVHVLQAAWQSMCSQPMYMPMPGL